MCILASSTGVGEDDSSQSTTTTITTTERGVFDVVVVVVVVAVTIVDDFTSPNVTSKNSYRNPADADNLPRDKHHTGGDRGSIYIISNHRGSSRYCEPHTAAAAADTG